MNGRTDVSLKNRYAFLLSKKQIFDKNAHQNQQIQTDESPVFDDPFAWCEFMLEEDRIFVGDWMSIEEKKLDQIDQF
jgi:hypothetical protein